MTLAPSPATIAVDLNKQINRALEAARFYLEPDDFAVKKFLREADKLVRADAVAGYAARARVHQLTGNIEEARSALAKAEALGFSHVVQAVRCAILTNLGFFSEAQLAYTASADPRAGLFAQEAYIGLTCGAFQRYAAFLQDAERIGLEYDAAHARNIIDASKILIDCRITDERVGDLLNILGTKMRARRMFFLGSVPDFYVWTRDQTDQFVHLAYRFPLDGEDAETLDTELITSFLDASDSLPDCLSINAKSGLTLDERLTRRAVSAGQEVSRNSL